MSASEGKADVRFEQKPIFDSPLTAISGQPNFSEWDATLATGVFDHATVHLDVMHTDHDTRCCLIDAAATMAAAL